MIHLTLEVMPILKEILGVSRPTMVFAVPYSGHEWASFGSLRKQPLGAKMEVQFIFEQFQHDIFNVLIWIELHQERILI